MMMCVLCLVQESYQRLNLFTLQYIHRLSPSLYKQPTLHCLPLPYLRAIPINEDSYLHNLSTSI
jgi:hypothetical protein